MAEQFDVVIVGGGPAGSTVATMLHKYRPHVRTLILEREKFPRDHVGESQLPVISVILDEMEVWDKIERCNFPIKVGATYRWGKTNDLWDFEFLNDGVLRPEPRPAKYEGQRRQTAFQVDRAVYDHCLLEHARYMGATVREQTAVREVLSQGDRIEGLRLADDSVVTGRYYVDCSGHSGIIRRAMGVEVSCPTTLQNIAIWDYFQNAKWAVNIGVGGTRVQVMSVGYGWIWFIPLGPTRTSVGLIVPAEYYRSCGKKPQELFQEATYNDEVISQLLEGAVSEQKLSTTKDWSFVADRLVGENWFLAGESAGFADPILAAGMSLAHAGAREVAYTIMALDHGQYEAEWLKGRYDESHRRQIGQHIKFADFWYTQNAHFRDLKEFTRELAGDRGLDMTADEAWRWFGQGGFIDHDNVATEVGGYSIISTKHIAAQFTGEQLAFDVSGKTHFQIDLEGADKRWGAFLAEGRITRHRAFHRAGKYLPNVGLPGWLIVTLKEPKSFEEIAQAAAVYAMQNGMDEEGYARFRRQFLESLEAMAGDGWVKAWTVEGFEPMPEFEVEVEKFMHVNRDIGLTLTQAK